MTPLTACEEGGWQGERLASAVVGAEAASVAFNPACDDELCVLGDDGVTVWTLHTSTTVPHAAPQLVPCVVDVHGFCALAVAWLPGAVLLMGTDDGALLLADARTGTLHDHTTDDGALLLADARTGTLHDHTTDPRVWGTLGGAVCALAVHRHHVLAATADGALQLVSTPRAHLPNTVLQVLWEHTLAEDDTPLEVTALCYSPTFDRVALATSDAALYMLTLHPTEGGAAPQAQLDCVAEYHCGAVTALAALPDGDHFASCGKPRPPCCNQSRRGVVLMCLLWCCCAGDDGALHIWSASQRTLAFRRQLSAPLSALAVCPRASLLALGSAEGVVRVFALPAHGAAEPVLMFRARLHARPVAHLSFSPSGHQVCTLPPPARAVWKATSADPGAEARSKIGS